MAPQASDPANSPVEQTFLDALRSSPRLKTALSITGVATTLTLAAAGLAPCIAGGLAVGSITTWLNGLGANALAGWIANWSVGAGRRFFDRKPSGERELVDALARALQSQLDTNTSLQESLARLLERTGAVRMAMTALTGQVEQQMQLLQGLHDDMERYATIERRLFGVVIRLLHGLSYDLGQGFAAMRQELELLRTSLERRGIVFTALHQLPAPVPDFVGRATEIDALLHALTPRSQGGAGKTVAAIRGLGGSGKTQLAYAVGDDLSSFYPDAQIVLDLRGSGADAVPPEQALQTVLRAFDPQATLPPTCVTWRNCIARCWPGNMCSSLPTTPVTPSRCARWSRLPAPPCSSPAACASPCPAATSWTSAHSRNPRPSTSCSALLRASPAMPPAWRLCVAGCRSRCA